MDPSIATRKHIRYPVHELLRLRSALPRVILPVSCINKHVDIGMHQIKIRTQYNDVRV